MTTDLKNRYDFMLFFDVKDGNPNGDPDAGNLPRIDTETGEGLVTDVCLKRKIRNYVQILPLEKLPSREGYDIYIKEKAVLGRAHVEAFKSLGIDVGQESSKTIPFEMTADFEDIDLCDGLSLRINEDEAKQLVVASDADKKAIKEWEKEVPLTKPVKKFIDDLLKEAKPRKPTAAETEKGRDWMCQHYFDIRTFGAVMSLKSAPNCGQVRGPVQLTFARSVDPIVTAEHSITRMSVATEAEAEKQSGDNRTMGRKNTVPYGLYVAYGFVSPALAAQTGFSEDDLKLLWDSLINMFDGGSNIDHSAARGMMATQKLIIFKHDTALGNAPSHKLFDLVKIEKKKDVAVPRKFADYIVTIPNDSELPSGVHIETEWL